MLKKFLILIFICLLPLVSAVSMEDTLIVNTITNYSVYINQTIMFGSLEVTDEGRIEFHDLDTTVYSGKFHNTNDTYTSILDFFNLHDAIIYYDNGTILEQQFTGNKNISLESSDILTIINDYSVTVPSTPVIGDDVNQGGGGSTNNTKINNTLIGPVLIKIFGLSDSFIYFSNGSVMRFLDGDLNVTLENEEYFYILNFNQLQKLNENSGLTAHDSSGKGNDGTINGATWNDDGVDVTFIEGIDYTLIGSQFTMINNNFLFVGTSILWNYLMKGQNENDVDSVIRNYSQSAVNVSAQFPTVGTIIGLAILLLVLIGILAFAIKAMMGIAANPTSSVGSFG